MIDESKRNFFEIFSRRESQSRPSNVASVDDSLALFNVTVEVS